MRWLERVRLPRERRTLRHVLAAWSGYFWLPCPCCGVDFAGYEAGRRLVYDAPPTDGSRTSRAGHLCCRWCDTCSGADQERAALQTLAPFLVLLDGPTPPERKCRLRRLTGRSAP